MVLAVYEFFICTVFMESYISVQFSTVIPCIEKLLPVHDFLSFFSKFGRKYYVIYLLFTVMITGNTTEVF